MTKSLFVEDCSVQCVEKHCEFSIAHKDNLEFIRDIEDNSIKLIITSPPYNIGKEYEKVSPLEAYIEGQRTLVAECHRILHPQGSICWQVGNYVSKNDGIVPLDIALFPIFADLGLKLRNRIIWHFEHGLHCKKRFSGRHEAVLWFTKTDDYTFNLDPVRVPSKYPNKRHYKGPNAGKLSCNPKGKNPGDLWIIPNVKANHVEKTDHPCQFPVELVERFVLSLTEERDLVFDPYMGAGSSIIAAIMHDRIGMGCDIESKYVGITEQRIKDFKEGILKTRPMGKPVYNPSLPSGGHK